MPTREQVIEWARDAGYEYIGLNLDVLEPFAALAYAAGQSDEREVLANACEQVAEESHTTIFLGATDEYLDGRAMGATVCAANIRARDKL